VTKLSSVLAAALLILPTVTLNATALPGAEARPGLASPKPVTGMCYIYLNGRWWLLPC
jgi:hypothetical protein